MLAAAAHLSTVEAAPPSRLARLAGDARAVLTAPTALARRDAPTQLGRATLDGGVANLRGPVVLRGACAHRRVGVWQLIVVRALLLLIIISTYLSCQEGDTRRVSGMVQRALITQISSREC